MLGKKTGNSRAEMPGHDKAVIHEDNTKFRIKKNLDR